MQQNDLHNKLNDAFRPLHLSVHDDSARHAGHAEAPAQGGSHFTVILVSQAFEGLDRISRHRAVNQVLEEAFVTEDIHALSLRIFTPSEWNNSPAQA